MSTGKISHWAALNLSLTHLPFPITDSFSLRFFLRCHFLSLTSTSTVFFPDKDSTSDEAPTG